MLVVFAACGSTQTDQPQEPTTSGEGTQPDDTGDEGEEPATSGDTFKLGLYGALTGTNAAGGISYLEAAELYVEELNARGGLAGKQVEIISYDDANLPEEAVKCATKLVEVDQCDAVLAGFYSSCVIASGGVLDKAEVPFFVGGLSPSLTSQGWTYVVRTALNTNNNIPQLPNILKELGLTKIAIFQSQDDYGTTAGDNMRAAAESAGIEVTTSESYVSGDTDFSGQVNKIIGSDPDAIFLGAPGNDTGTLVKQMRQYGWDGLIFGSELINTAQLEIAGESADYMMFAYPYVLYDNIEDYEGVNEEMYEFQHKFYDKYGYTPSTDTAYRAWDALVLLEKAVNETGSTDGKDIIDAIYGMSDVKSLSGYDMDFTKTKDGDCMFEFSYYVYVDGKPITMDQWRETDDFAAYAESQGWEV